MAQVNQRRTPQKRGIALHTRYGGPGNVVKGPPPVRQRRNESTKSPSKAISATPAVAPNRKPSDRLFGGS